MQLSLSLNQAAVPEIISMAGAEIRYYHDVFSPGDADRYFEYLLRKTPWRQEYLSFAGKRIAIPRLQAWYGDHDSHYSYSGLPLAPLPWTRRLSGLKAHAEALAGTDFNSVLINYYRDGNDSVAWHSDNEKELGHSPVIASISFGCPRRFELKPRSGGSAANKVCCNLAHGSVLVMGAGVQENWLHQIPKQAGLRLPRINLTFRAIQKSSCRPAP
ncbi:MAG: alpha-ketoglutarate-dependent dioxygenase AlkB [Pseudomonadales bacterium]|nr:alpha-ketoglutarate-dependent dioxygenase AlkB [Pseudomonadales bacterium]